jgi:hypothetical protein
MICSNMLGSTLRVTVEIEPAEVVLASFAWICKKDSMGRKQGHERLYRNKKFSTMYSLA